jgi:DinB superfamily
MNAGDVLKYGHLWVHKHLDGLTEEEWETPGVCGWWSVREIMAHLASYEQVLVDVLNSFVSTQPTPTLDQYRTMNGDSFNEVQVSQRKGKKPPQVLEEYDRLHAEVRRLLPKIPDATLRQAGALPWYGMQYDLEDFIVYAFYGHKREHCAQIAVYRDKLQK